jgi:hypothetical protein
MGREMIARRPAAALFLALFLPAAALGFWGKKTDEEKLKNKLDSLKVHLYLSGKAALTKTAGSDEATVVKERLLALVSGTARTVKALQKKEGEPAVEKEQAPGLSLKEVAGLGKALWDMRAVGKEVLAADKDTLPPVLPVVLTPMGVSPELVSRLDRPTDHAALFVALALVKLHPSSPVPIASEIILYEGTRMDPAQVKVPGFTPQLHGLKAYTLAMSGLCDLAEKEALTLEAMGPVEESSRVSAGLKLLTGKEMTLSEAQLGYMGASTEVLAQGSLAVCYFSRAAWAKGQQALGRFLDAADRSGIDLPELHVLRAYTECGSKTPEKGKARLKALAARSDLTEDVQDDLKYLEKSCGTQDAEGMQKLVSSVRLGKVIVLVTWEHLKRSGLIDALGELEWVKAVRDFVSTLGQGSSKAPGGIKAPGSDYVSHGGWDWD